MQNTINEIKTRRRQYIFGLVILIGALLSGYFFVNNMLIAAVSSVLSPFILILIAYLIAIFKYAMRPK